MTFSYLLFLFLVLPSQVAFRAGQGEIEFFLGWMGLNVMGRDWTGSDYYSCTLFFVFTFFFPSSFGAYVVWFFSSFGWGFVRDVVGKWVDS